MKFSQHAKDGPQLAFVHETELVSSAMRVLDAFDTKVALGVAHPAPFAISISCASLCIVVTAPFNPRFHPTRAKIGNDHGSQKYKDLAHHDCWIVSLVRGMPHFE